MEKYLRPLRRSYVLNLFERVTNLSYPVLFAAWLTLIVLFSVVYAVLSIYAPLNGIEGIGQLGLWRTFGNALYFSVITSTTVGYGDLLPLGFSKALSAIEAVSAFFVFGVFTAKILSKRSDVILDELHQFIYNTNTQHVRESMHIIRTDLNAIMAEGREKGDLSERSWDMLTVASTEGQRIMEELPTFFAHEGEFAIDVRREKLLLEALHRTLDRWKQLFVVLDEQKIDWRGHEHSLEELRSFLQIGSAILPVWKRHGLRQNGNRFDGVIAEMQELCDTMHVNSKAAQKKRRK